MTSGVTKAGWIKALNPPWNVTQPNHGFMLRTGDRIVGVYAALYSERQIEGKPEQFCNLAAWCVLEDYRAHGLRLLRALLSQRGFHFTDLSPSGNVVALNARLKFTALDTSTALVPNLPWPTRSTSVRIVSLPAAIEQTLKGRDLQIYQDHAQTAASRHVVVVAGDQTCYVIYRRVRRKRLPIFASLLYVGNPHLFSHTNRYFFGHLLLRHGIPFTLSELRVGGHRPVPSVMVKARPKMYRSASLSPNQIDYLYSELTCVAW
jgi:hypothetical protein